MSGPQPTSGPHTMLEKNAIDVSRHIPISSPSGRGPRSYIHASHLARYPGIQHMVSDMSAGVQHTAVAWAHRMWTMYGVTFALLSVVLYFTVVMFDYQEHHVEAKTVGTKWDADGAHRKHMSISSAAFIGAALLFAGIPLFSSLWHRGLSPTLHRNRDFISFPFLAAGFLFMLAECFRYNDEHLDKTGSGDRLSGSEKLWNYVFAICAVALLAVPLFLAGWHTSKHVMGE